MTWLNGWAWAGLITVLLPALIHLLGRGHARVQKFPTLRFVEASRLLPARRTRLHDTLLLAARIGALTAAVAALAHPLLLTARRKQSLDRGLARAIIVDTSASMLRRTSAGRRAMDVARDSAQLLAAAAQASVTIESDVPSRSIAAAVAWLARQARRGEIIVVSDFQRGTITHGDFRDVPATVGLTPVRIGVVDAAAGIETRARVGDRQVTARTLVSPERTSVEWALGPMVGGDSSLVVLSGDADRAAVSAAIYAAGTRAVRLPLDTTRAAAIVFPGYPGRDRLRASSAPVTAPWMVDLLVALRADSLPIAGAAEGMVDGRHRVILFAASAPGTLQSARLIAAANTARSAAPPVSELEPETLGDAALAIWRRTPAVDSPSPSRPLDGNTPSDGRWLWVVALLFLGVEAILRRAPASRMPTAESKRDARAA